MESLLMRILCSLLLLVTSGLFAGEPQGGKQVAQKLECKTDNQPLHYLLYLPKDYGAKKDWPVVLFLHGAGERGDGNLELVKKHGPPKLAEEKSFPFIVVSPQCPKETRWSDANHLARLDELLTHLTKNYRVDPARIFLTGLSMGGQGTWALAAKHPNRFAAIAPMCGRGELGWAKTIKHVPVWCFIGDQDKQQTVDFNRQMIRAIKDAGGDPKFTIYINVGHDCWTASYANPKFYAWLLSHRLKGQ